MEKGQDNRGFQSVFACYRGGEDNGFVIMRLYCGTVYVVRF